MEEPRCPKCKSKIEITNTESFICNKCRYWENSFGEKGYL